MKSRLATIAAGLLSFAASTVVPADAAPPEIWMWGSPKVDHPVPGWEEIRKDKGDLWEPDAPWQSVARSVRVILIPPGNIERARPGDLHQAVGDIKRRHMALAVGTGLLLRSDRCRSKSEAYVEPGALDHLFDKLRRNGADVQYVAMDEPYFYGHKNSAPTACHESAETLARALVEGIAVVRKYFPQVQIGSDEVLTQDREWVDELTAWVDTYQRLTGEKLAFMHVDLGWKPGSVANLKPLAAALQRRGVPLGVIYDADDSNNNSDENWARNTIRHFTEVESELGVRPDHAVIETWTRHPARVLPETEPGTLTNVVLRYIGLPRSR